MKKFTKKESEQFAKDYEEHQKLSEEEKLEALRKLREKILGGKK